LIRLGILTMSRSVSYLVNSVMYSLLSPSSYSYHGGGPPVGPFRSHIFMKFLQWSSSVSVFHS